MDLPIYTRDAKQHLLMQTKQQANLPSKAEEDMFSRTAPGNMAAALSRWRKKTKNKILVHYFKL